MAAHEHIQPEQLRTLANEHGDKHFKNFRDPDKRETSMCGAYSDHFSQKCGLSHAYVVDYDLGENDYAHTVNLVKTSRGPYVVDFTYNQFDRKAKVPVVEPRSRYEKRFSRVRRGKPYQPDYPADLD